MGKEKDICFRTAVETEEKVARHKNAESKKEQGLW